MAEFKENFKIPEENLIYNTNNKKWQEIRRASNIFASLVLNMKENLTSEKIDTTNLKIEDLCLYSDSIAIITNISFSIELALKTILAYQNNFKTGHKLNHLFKHLDSRTKRLIIKYININGFCFQTKFQSESDFMKALEPIDNLYVKYRYFFDDQYNLKSFNKDIYLLFILFDMLIKYINCKLK